MRIYEPRIDYKLQERLYNLQKDVDFIYDHAFKEFVDDFYRGELKPLEYYGKKLNSDFKFVTFSTKELTTKECKEADSKLSIPIYCGVFEDGNLLSTYHGDSSKTYLQLSLNFELIDILYSFNIKNVSEMKNVILDKELKRAKNELDSGRIKASIAHELSHWIDGANYDIFNKITAKGKNEIDRSDLLKLKNKDVTMTYFEIQGQIHGISQIKNKYQKDWNDFTLKDLFIFYTPLYGITQTLHKKYGTDIVLIWLKNLIKRMAREGLLGVNMKIPSDISRLLEDKSFRV